jgi:NADH-quinone oxidoreductase subunit E
MSVEFSPEAKKEFEAILTRYPEKRAALLPTLHLAQREFGWISTDVMKYISELLGIPVQEVYDTASFYTMFKLEPTGKYLIQVCSTLSCYLRGSKEIVEHLKQKYGIDVGETTKDGKFTLWKVECLGSCGTAPVVQINDDYYEDMTIEKLDQVLDNLE